MFPRRSQAKKPEVSGQKQNNIKKYEKLNFVCKNVVFLQRNANVVQLVEHQLPKLRVAGSSPVIRSNVENFLLPLRYQKGETHKWI